MSAYKQCGSILLCAMLALSSLLSSARAQSPGVTSKVVYGAIVGLVTNSAKQPVAGATVTAVRVDGSSIRATVSGSDGVYSFADLTPGAWSVTAQLEGAAEVVVTAAEVIAGRASRNDLVMVTGRAAPSLGAAPASPALAQQPLPAAAPAAVAQPAAGALPEALQAPEPGPENDTYTPLANVGDIGWMNGTPREKSPIFDTKFFTPEIRFDMNYLQGLQPSDRPHHRRIDRGVPLRRVPDRAGELRRGFPLGQRAGALSVDVRHVRDHHAAQ